MNDRKFTARLDGVQLLDVREPDEWAAGDIFGALHIPRPDVEPRLGKLARDSGDRGHWAS